MGIRPGNNCCGNEAGLVQKFIGSAYDTVKDVADRLEEIKFIFDFMSKYDVLLCVESAEELKKVNWKASKFARVYLQGNGSKTYVDYIYVGDDKSGVIPEDIKATGSWVKVDTLLGAGGSNSIPWLYNHGSANGGETSIHVEEDAIGVSEIFINGLRKHLGIGYTYEPVSRTIQLSAPLVKDDQLVAKLIGYPALPNTPNISEFMFVNWVYNNGTAIGGETKLKPPYTFQKVPAVYINGLRKLENHDYVVGYSDYSINLTLPLKTNDAVIVQLGGEADALSIDTHTVREALRRTYSEAGLVLVDGSFEDGAKVTTKQDVVLERKTGKGYGWQGDIPSGGKVIPVGSTPASTGGIGPNKWQDLSNTTYANQRELANGKQYILYRAFEAAVTLTQVNEAVQFSIGGAFYRWDGVFPQGGLIIPQNTPEPSSDQMGKGKYITVSDLAIKDAIYADLSSQTGATKIGYQLPTGANPGSRLDTIISGRYIDAKEYGIVPGVVISSEQLQPLLDNRRIIFTEPGEYIFNPTILTWDEAAPDKVNPQIKVWAKLHRNMTLCGVPGVVFKMADNVSTLANPKHLRGLFSNEFLKDILIYGIDFDMNGDNNKINTESGVAPRNYTQAPICFSGTSSTGIAAGCDNLVIDNCKFRNNAGVSCIVTAQSNTEGVRIGKGVTISDCTFTNNGLNTSDHSAVYTWSTDVRVFGCTFDNFWDAARHRGGLCAMEIHGSRTRFYDNVIKGYSQSIWVSINYTETVVQDIIVYGNTMDFLATGIGFYSANLPVEQGKGSVIMGVNIYGNCMNAMEGAVDESYRVFLSVAAGKQPYNVKFHNNNCRSFSTTKDVALASIVTGQFQLRKADKIIINDNSADGITTGLLIYLIDSPQAGVGRVEFTDNDLGYLQESKGVLTKASLHVYGNPLVGKVDSLKANNIEYLVAQPNTISELKGKLTVPFSKQIGVLAVDCMMHLDTDSVSFLTVRATASGSYGGNVTIPMPFTALSSTSGVAVDDRVSLANAAVSTPVVCNTTATFLEVLGTSNPKTDNFTLSLPVHIRGMSI